MGKRPGQAAVLKCPAGKMCCPAKNAAEFASGRTTNRSPVDETEGAASGNASASMESSPSRDANAQGLATGNDSSASAIAELSALNLEDLRKGPESVVYVSKMQARSGESGARLKKIAGSPLKTTLCDPDTSLVHIQNGIRRS